jgi:sRNA-binding carbon storage regulator CsrA
MPCLSISRRLGESVLLSHPTGPVVIDFVKFKGSQVCISIRAAEEVKISRINNKGEVTKEKA